MNFEERIEKLTERHEALTQTIELMMHENRERHAAWEARISRAEGSLTQWDKRFDRIVKALEQLTHVAEDHEHRLDNLEGTV